jgi:hypothetical protein
MSGRRQAWCPRCDELRPARPGAACPVCGRGLLPLPAARTPEPRGAGPAARAATRLAGLLPALRAASTGLVVLAVVAGTFAAGRVTRATPTTPQAAPATTAPPFADQGPLAGRRVFGWHAERSGVGVTLEQIEVGSTFTRVDLNVDGLAAGESVTAVHGLRILDARGRDLAPSMRTADNILSPDSGLRGDSGSELRLAAPIDWQQVAAVRLTSLTVSHPVTARLRGAVVDAGLRHTTDTRPEDLDGQLPACKGCRVELTCAACRTVKPAGSGYGRPGVVLLLVPRGPLGQSAINPGGQLTVSAGPAGNELTSWRDTAPDGTTAVGFDARELARDTDRGNPRMRFTVDLAADAEHHLRGPWTITQPGAP